MLIPTSALASRSHRVFGGQVAKTTVAYPETGNAKKRVGHRFGATETDKTQYLKQKVHYNKHTHPCFPRDDDLPISSLEILEKQDKKTMMEKECNEFLCDLLPQAGECERERERDGD